MSSERAGDLDATDVAPLEGDTGVSAPPGECIAGRLLGEADRPDEARRLIDHALWVDPRLPFARIERIRSFGVRGDFDAVVRELAEMLYEPIVPEPEMAPFARIYSIHARAAAETGELGVEGRHQLLALAEQAAPVSRPRRLFEQLLAEILARVGDLEGAMQAVLRAVLAGLEDLAWIDHCPAILALHDDPRFPAQREVLRARAAEITRAWDDP